MKKSFIILFALVCSLNAKPQADMFGFMTSVMDLAYGGQFYDVGISYSRMTADNSFYYGTANSGYWNAVGIHAWQYLFTVKGFDGGFSYLIDYAWATKTDNDMLNLALAFNCGYNFPVDSSGAMFLSPHAGIGCSWDLVYMDDAASYFYKDSYYQITGTLPVGVKLKYKRVFADFTYMLRFARSKIHYQQDDDWYYSDYYKSQPNVASHIKTFPFVLTIGMRF